MTTTAVAEYHAGMTRAERDEHRAAVHEHAARHERDTVDGRPSSPPPPRSWWARQIAAERHLWKGLRQRHAGVDEIILYRLLAAVWAIIWYGYTKPRSFLGAHLLGLCSHATYLSRVDVCRECPSRRHKRGLPDVASSHCWGQPGGRTCCPTGRYWPFSRLGWMLRLANRPCPRDQFRGALPVCKFMAIAAIGVLSFTLYYNWYATAALACATWLAAVCCARLRSPLDS